MGRIEAEKLNKKYIGIYRGTSIEVRRYGGTSVTITGFLVSGE